MSDPSLEPCFLGPYGENDALLEPLVVEFLRDHVYWRRNIHPEDPPAIPTRARLSPQYAEFEARLRQELHALSAALKRSVPFHSQRYLGHMVSDLLLPGLAEALALLGRGMKFTSLNIGGMHYSAGKNLSIGKAIFLNDEDCAALKALAAAGIKIEGRGVPSDTPLDLLGAIA